MRRLTILFVVVAAASMPWRPSAHEPPAGERAPLVVPAMFATIQQAVDVAEPGDVIYVEPGTYCEQVLITKSNLRVRQRAAGQGERPVLTAGECATQPYGFRVAGTATQPVANVEISGFVIDGFPVGIQLQNAVYSRVTSNEVRNIPRSAIPGSGNGILLVASSFNEVSGNFAHDNGHLGIGVSGGAGNIVRGNRLVDNQTQFAWSCSLMLYAGTVGNQVIDNVIENASVPNTGWGIMIGPGSPARNLVYGNRIVGHLYAGLGVVLGSASNVLLENDASGNGLSEEEPDLVDRNVAGTNTWRGNTGTCAPGNAGC